MARGSLDETRVDIPAADAADFTDVRLQRQSGRRDRRMFRQPSTVIVIRNASMQSDADDTAAVAAAAEGSTTTPLLVSRTDDGDSHLRITTHDVANLSRSDSHFENNIMWAQNVSLAANLLLLAVKAWAFVISRSYAVLASMADSGVDLASQVVLFFCNRAIGKLDPRYPIGRTRLETVTASADVTCPAVPASTCPLEYKKSKQNISSLRNAGCAVIMALSSWEVIQAAIGTLWDFWQHATVPHIGLSWLMYIVLGLATGLKVVLYVICIAYAKKSPTMAALAEDHRNDVLSNTVAIATAFVATRDGRLWWIDPVGAICLSAYIVYCWSIICYEQLDLMVGKGAPEDYLTFLQDMANLHDPSMKLDELRAYHFGTRYIVELEVVMPANMTVQESHDIGLRLQHKIEALEEVERCFVHIDYAERDIPEHKVERNLALGRSVNEPHESARDGVPTFEEHHSGRWEPAAVAAASVAAQGQSSGSGQLATDGGSGPLRKQGSGKA